jgi:hypothetical protein
MYMITAMALLCVGTAARKLVSTMRYKTVNYKTVHLQNGTCNKAVHCYEQYVTEQYLIIIAQYHNRLADLTLDMVSHNQQSSTNPLIDEAFGPS